MDDYRASAMSGLFDAPEAAESDLDEGVKECMSFLAARRAVS
jgi:hypothetical protein